MLKRFLEEKVLTFTGPNYGGILTGDPLVVNLKTTNPELACVSIGTRLLSH